MAISYPEDCPECLKFLQENEHKAGKEFKCPNPKCRTEWEIAHFVVPKEWGPPGSKSK